MPSQATKPSIRKQLLIYLMAPLCAVWLLTTLLSCSHANDEAQDIYDQELVNSADSIVARSKFTSPTSVNVDLPARVRRIFEHYGADKFYYNVRDTNSVLLNGLPALAAPASIPQLSHPKFANGVIQGQPVRICYVTEIEDETNTPILVTLAETYNTRNELTKHIFLNNLLSQLMLIVFGSSAIYFGVSRGLVPLRTLQAAIVQRSSTDLRPVPDEDVPTEVWPLVNAINDLLVRLRAEIDSQKRFVANAAHQLRTPLAGLKTYNSVARKLATETELVDVLEQMDEGTDRLTHMVNQLLSLARAEPTNRKKELGPVDLNAVVSDALTDLVPLSLKKNIELGFESESSDITVNGDSDGLQELVTNIVENAILYTQSGGTVSVRLSNGDRITLGVQDDGPGIPAEERQKVFERFYRVIGTEANGSGLGLSIVKEIASSHNASVEITDGIKGKGTQVLIHFPPANERA